MARKKLSGDQLTHIVNALSDLGEMCSWGDTADGRDYWLGVCLRLKGMLESKTTDGKPYVEPEPPIPDGYRLAVDSDAGRKDMMLFDEDSATWKLRPWPAMPMFLGHGYIVPADIAPTDEEASRLPLVMVRDYDDRPWERKVLVRVASTGLFHCLGLSRRNLESWSRCRHLYSGE